MPIICGIPPYFCARFVLNVATQRPIVYFGFLNRVCFSLIAYMRWPRPGQPLRLFPPLYLLLRRLVALPLSSGFVVVTNVLFLVVL